MRAACVALGRKEEEESREKKGMVMGAHAQSGAGHSTMQESRRLSCVRAHWPGVFWFLPSSFILSTERLKCLVRGWTGTLGMLREAVVNHQPTHRTSIPIQKSPE